MTGALCQLVLDAIVRARGQLHKAPTCQEPAKNEHKGEQTKHKKGLVR
jgi:hypothetical protein